MRSLFKDLRVSVWVRSARAGHLQGQALGDQERAFALLHQPHSLGFEGPCSFTDFSCRGPNLRVRQPCSEEGIDESVVADKPL
jgi:hypothetical protein